MIRSSLGLLQLKTLAERSWSRIHRSNLVLGWTRTPAVQSLSMNRHSNLELALRKSKKIRSNLESARTKRQLLPSWNMIRRNILALGRRKSKKTHSILVLE